jgi:hypothetical protein
MGDTVQRVSGAHIGIERRACWNGTSNAQSDQDSDDRAAQPDKERKTIPLALGGAGEY